MFDNARSGLLLTLLLVTVTVNAEQIFDAHLHYNAADAKQLDSRAVIQTLDRNGISYAVVTAAPASHAAELYSYAPERIIPLLGLYRDHTDKADWHEDMLLPDYVQAELKSGFWRGVGPCVERDSFGKENKKCHCD
jgi:hypothetical protein